MPHQNPSDHPDSAASAFAPFQPAAGVVADDVPDSQNPAGGPKAKAVTKELAPILAKQREKEAKDSEKAAEDARKATEEHAASRDPDATVEVNAGVVTAVKAKK